MSSVELWSGNKLKEEIRKLATEGIHFACAVCKKDDQQVKFAGILREDVRNYHVGDIICKNCAHLFNITVLDGPAAPTGFRTPATIIGRLTVDCPDALRFINGIFEDALKSGKHKPNDWRKLGVVGNRKHLVVHYSNWHIEASDQDHLANMACRALMLLQLRCEETKSDD